MIQKMITMLLTFTVSFPIFAQDEQVRARVQKIEGKEIYVLNEPLRSYEVIGEVKTGLKLTSIVTRGIINEHINDKTTQFVRRMNRKMEKSGMEFDALLYQDGKKIQAIRFTQAATPANEGIARVKAINNVSSFIMAEPLQDYQVMETISTGIKLVPFLTYGLINNSIERDVKTFVRKAAKKGEANFLVYTSGRRASAISLN